MHIALLEALNAHGNLVFASDAEAHAFVTAVKGGRGLPPGAAQRWTETLIRLRRLGRISVFAPPGDREISSVRALDDLRQAWGGRIEIAVLSDEASVCVGLPADEG